MPQRNLESAPLQPCSSHISQDWYYLTCSLHANTVFPAYTQSFSKSCRASPLYLTPSLSLTPNTLTVAQGSSLTFSTSLQSHSKHVVWELHASTDEARERRVHNSTVTQPEQQKPLTHDDWLTLNQWSYLHLNSLASGPASTLPWASYFASLCLSLENALRRWHCEVQKCRLCLLQACRHSPETSRLFRNAQTS